MEDEIVAGTGRHLSMMMMTSTQLATGMVAARAQTQRDARRMAEQEARDLQRRMQIQRRADLAALEPVHKPAWWATATPEQIAEKHELAQRWKASEPDAQNAFEVIGTQVRERYGLNINALEADRAQVLARTADLAEQRSTMNKLAAQAEHDRAAVSVLLAEATAYDVIAADQHARADGLQGLIDWENPDRRDLAIFERAEQMHDAAREAAGTAEHIRGEAEIVKTFADWRENQAGLLLGRTEAADRALFNETGQRPSERLEEDAATHFEAAAANTRAADELTEKMRAPEPDLPHDTPKRIIQAREAAEENSRRGADARERAGQPAAAAATRTAAAEELARAEAWTDPERIEKLRRGLTDRDVDPELVQTKLLTERARKTPPEAAVTVSPVVAPKARKNTRASQSQSRARKR